MRIWRAEKTERQAVSLRDSKLAGSGGLPKMMRLPEDVSWELS